ncbi:MAG: hypothetical protein R3E50_14450 [Halioglobus sp.]
MRSLTLTSARTISTQRSIKSYHDIYPVNEADGWPAIDAADFLGQIHRAFETQPDVSLIVDHYATPGSGNSATQELHRIDVEFIKGGYRQPRLSPGCRIRRVAQPR